MIAGRALSLCVVLLTSLLLAACVAAPIAYEEDDREKTEAAEQAFRATGSLDRFFDEAVAWAVLPGTVRIGSGFGGAFGRGWLLEAGVVTGRVQVAEIFVGANVGGQSYRTILFFRTEDSLEKFKAGRFEFTGQANATAVTAGKSVTPSYSREVAMFVQVRGGLLLEASVGGQRYDFFPLAKDVAGQGP